MRLTLGGLWFIRLAAAVFTRANLTIVREALNEKVVLERGRATGIVYRHRGQRVTAQASREVILAAGSIGSPRTLPPAWRSSRH